ncbi:SWIM zinc finger family protein [Solibacillus sp. FSL K6-4121]|uniref:SWIM zinc finger family protein n=1 Tax=Solibacillus sp. FSL K6-4121 TaxID=2921505 RepID=UPI0030F5A192
MSLTFSEIAHAHKDFIQHTLQTFEDQLHPSADEDAELVTRAMFSIRNQAIKPPHYSTFTQILVCQIQDVNTAEVTINFPNKEISCSCPKKELCRHQLATILKLSQYFISLQQWLSNWRSKKSIPLHSLAATRSPENWQRMADEILNYAVKGPQPIEPYALSALSESIRSKIQRHRPYEQEWQELYQLFMDVAILKHFLLHAVKTKSDMEHHYFQFFLENTLSRIQRSIDVLSKTTRLFATEPFYDALQQSVRDILFIEKGAKSFRLALYLQFWTKLFYEKKRITNELMLLEQSSDIETDLDLDVVLAIFYILLGSTSPLKRVTEILDEDNVESFIEVAQYALQKSYVDEAAIILKKALPLLQTFVQDNLLPIRRQKFTRKLDKLYGQISLTEEEELALYASFGRYGIESFSNYLLRHNRLDEWVALHQLYKSSIPYLEQCGLKDVVAHSPETALPLYHYYAMEEIQQKSRQNYKQAVRIWRAMKNASKKAGKLDYFTSYIEAVQQQFKRLRALQEEMNKSNLLG